MRWYFRAFIETIKDVIDQAFLWCIDNLRNFTLLINFLLPYACLWIGQYCYHWRAGYGVGGEILLPMMVFILIHIINMFTNKIGKGTNIPVPSKRFTDIASDGMVSIPNDRLEELILYVGDLEDWMEKNNLM